MFRYALAVFTLALAVTLPAQASDVEIAADHATLVRLPADASAVVIGNPSVADAMVHDLRTLVITGRLPGRTNVIAVDRIGRIIYQSDIIVNNPEAGQVALFRGSNRTSLACGDTTCDEVPRVGDDFDRSGALNTQQQQRLATADTAAGGN
ncbi:MAG: pilus assembly protein CpaC [Alphaproteobacteria bacterium]|nr:pilus assembly protein CpaC [Alphaproteobacteria bacterium]